MNTPAPAPRSLKTTPKISVKIWRPILDKLTVEANALMKGAADVARGR